MVSGVDGFFVFFDTPSGDVDSSEADWSVDEALESIGYADAMASTDFDHDGANELLLSEAFSPDSRTHVWFGPLVPGTAGADTADLKLIGPDGRYEGIGSQFDALPDQTGDGLPELLVGASYVDLMATKGGAVYLLSLADG